MEHIVSAVTPGSIAEEMEIEPGDVLVSVNGQEPEDVFDYRYLMNEEEVLVVIRKPDGEEWELEIEKEYEDDLGMEFENGLMDDYRSCRNKCMFCFIDQLPKGMRDTLYFKDDDSRLSFLQGNYLTLTNMSEHDLEKIIYYKLSPINISFQATNPELRCKMLHNRFAGDLHRGNAAHDDARRNLGRDYELGNGHQRAVLVDHAVSRLHTDLDCFGLYRGHPRLLRQCRRVLYRADGDERAVPAAVL